MVGLLWQCSPISTPILVCFSVALIKHGLKATQGEKDLFDLTAYSSPLREAKAGTQGRNLETGAEAETVEEHCLVACFSGH